MLEDMARLCDAVGLYTTGWAARMATGDHTTPLINIPDVPNAWHDLWWKLPDNDNRGVELFVCDEEG